MDTGDPQDLDLDRVLLGWQQGDAILGDHLSFVHIADLTKPLTAEAKEAATFDAGVAVVATKLAGGIVITQTCDIVRASEDSPFVQVAALMEVPELFHAEVARGQRPNFAAVPALAERFLVARLDLTMTIEKTLLGTAPKDAVLRGCRNASELTAFAGCLSRKYSRFAFPDDFGTAVAKIQRRLREKHSKDGDDGGAYQALHEIRIVARPDWDGEAPQLLFLFVLKENVAAPVVTQAIDALMERFDRSGRFREVQHRVVSLDDLTASLYLASQPLDLDHLSTSSARKKTAPASAQQGSHIAATVAWPEQAPLTSKRG